MTFVSINFACTRIKIFTCTLGSITESTESILNKAESSSSLRDEMMIVQG